VKHEIKCYIEFSSTLVFFFYHESTACGPPACTVRPVATFVSYMYAIKIKQFRQMGIPLTASGPCTDACLNSFFSFFPHCKLEYYIRSCVCVCL